MKPLGAGTAFSLATVPASGGWTAASVGHIARPCASCSARKVCQAVMIGCCGKQGGIWEVGTRKVRANEAVYRIGDPLRNLYVPRGGACKSIHLSRDGRQQITGFRLSGEFLGMDAIASGRHETEAVALDGMVVCVLPYRAIEMLADHVYAVRHGVARLLSAEVVREAGLLMLVGNSSAEERVAAFLIDLSERYTARGYSGASLTLSMSREEIGSYLGMKLETVSRMFARLRQRGLIRLQGKDVHIIDLEGLRAL